MKTMVRSGSCQTNLDSVSRLW